MTTYKSARIGLLLCLPLAFAWAQSQTGSVSGLVTDESGAMVPNAIVTVTSSARQINNKVTTANDGRYSFPNLEPGSYDLEITAPGFKGYAQRGISLLANQTVRVDATLSVGEAKQTVEVKAETQQLNFDNAVHQEGIAPETINQLPLVVAGGPRNSASFIAFLPG